MKALSFTLLLLAIALAPPCEGRDRQRERRATFQESCRASNVAARDTAALEEAAYDWAYSHEGLNMIDSEARLFAVKVVRRMDRAGFENFCAWFAFAYGSEGLNLSRGHAEQMAWDMWTEDLLRFRQLHAFAASVRGLGRTRREAMAWAIEKMQEPSRRTDLFMDCFDFFFDRSGPDLKRPAAAALAEDFATRGDEAFRQLKADYLHAYENLNMNRIDARKWALERADAN